MGRQVTTELIIKTASLSNKAITRIGNILNSLGKLSLIAFTFLSGIVTISINSYRKSERSLNSLNRSLINQGIYSRRASADYQAMAKALDELSKFTDDEIISAQASLQNFIGQQEITQELMQAVIDFASAQNVSLKSAAEQFGKSLSSNTNALMRYGIILDVTASQADKTQQAIRAVTSKFGGQAKASIEGLGALIKTKQGFEKLFRLFGQSIAPLFTLFAREMIALSENIQTSNSVLSGFIAMTNNLMSLTILTKSAITVIAGTFNNFLGAFRSVFDGGKNISDIFSEARIASMKLLSNERINYYESSQALNIDNYNDRQKQSEDKLEAYRQTSTRRAARQQRELQTSRQAFEARSKQDLDVAISHESLKSNADLRRLNLSIQNETNQTKRLELEKRKRIVLEQNIYDMEARRSLVLSKLIVEHAQSQSDQLDNLLNNYAQMQRSQYSALITIAKVANIARMVSAGAIAVQATIKWVSMIPIVGPAIAPVIGGLVTAWVAEQIAAVRGVTLENASLGQAYYELSLGNIFGVLDMMLHDIPGMMDATLRMPAHLMEVVASAADDLGDKLGIMGLQFKSIALMQKALAKITNLFADVVGGVLDFAFGWLSDGGAVITDPISMNQNLVTPLEKVIRPSFFGSEIDVTVMGGLIPTKMESKRIAMEIHKGLGGALKIHG